MISKPLPAPQPTKSRRWQRTSFNQTLIALIRLLRWHSFRLVRRWEHRPLLERKRQVAITFGIILLVILTRFGYSYYFSFHENDIKVKPRAKPSHPSYAVCSRQISQFMHYFFTLNPTTAQLSASLDSAQSIGDTSVYTIRTTLANAGYYQAMLDVGVRQQLELRPATIDIDFSKSPYEFRAIGRLMLFSQKSVTIRNLVVKGQLLETPWKVYPQFNFEIHKFVVLDNSHLDTYAYGLDSLRTSLDLAHVNLDSLGSPGAVMDQLLKKAANATDSLTILEAYKQSLKKHQPSPTPAPQTASVDSSRRGK